MKSKKPQPDGNAAPWTQESVDAEKERLHRQMLSSISHDLKTPLAAVIGSLEIYTRMATILPPEKSAQLISTALSEAYRLDNFVTNILDMAKLENGMVPVRHESSDLEAVLRDCVEKFNHRYQTQSIAITPFAHAIRVTTDPALLGRLLALLIDNAMKYGGSPAAVTLGARQEGHGVTITVSDNGGGIPHEKTEEIFSKYTRLKRQDHQNAGTGLGLAIGRSIAHLLRGTLVASNNDHGGALFTLKIPETL
jgi:K+-sensing histidine kinase KdpD